MKVIILCGGAGTRFNNMYPKPMNLVNGIPMIFYTISSLKISELTIVYNTALDSVNFKNFLIEKFSSIKFSFVPIDFQTRGPAETLLIGLKDINAGEQILVLDNDNNYTDLDLGNLPCGNFIIYKDVTTSLTHYSFIKLDEGQNVVDVKERLPISSYICIGGYGFTSSEICRHYCRKLVLGNSQEETYLSKVFELMLKDGQKIQSCYLPKSYSLGTPADIVTNLDKIPTPKLRVVFDLDNTILKNKNLEKIEHIYSFIKYLKQNGHYVIIYTARNMVTTNGNLGKVLKNQGLIVLESLKKLGIEYDEIYFGKPYGDIYIDDKAFNTFDPLLFQQLGFYNLDSLRNDFKTNKYNRIVKKDKYTVTKYGNISGELFFYKAVANSKICSLFPKLKEEGNSYIDLEYINGSSLSNLYSEGLINDDMLCRLLDTVNSLHDTNIEDGTEVRENDMKAYYTSKFEDRSQDINQYPFSDFGFVCDQIRKNLEFFEGLINKIIHGDLWFSNIMIYKNSFKFFDMRGKIGNKLTIKGHKMYDWAKLYQSLIGFDCILDRGERIDEKIKSTATNTFWKYLLEKGISDVHEKEKIIKMCGYLIFGSIGFHSYSSPKQRELLWELVKECLETT